MEAARKNSPIHLGDKIEALAVLRDRKKELNADLKVINEEYEDLELQIMDALDQQNMLFAGGSRHRATISENVVPNVTDWDQLHEYAKENDALYLFERRVATSAWRELEESGEHVPGTEPFTRRSLSLRKL